MYHIEKSGEEACPNKWNRFHLSFIERSRRRTVGRWGIGIEPRERRTDRWTECLPGSGDNEWESLKWKNGKGHGSNMRSSKPKQTTTHLSGFIRLDPPASTPPPPPSGGKSPAQVEGDAEKKRNGTETNKFNPFAGTANCR